MKYSGPTFVRIRSGKHDKINASAHAYDVQELFNTGALENLDHWRIKTELEKMGLLKWPEHGGLEPSGKNHFKLTGALEH